MKNEVEFKFLVKPEVAYAFLRKKPINLKHYITQTYLFIGTDSEVRVRTCENIHSSLTKEAFLTLKQNTDFHSKRLETEIEIPYADALPYLNTGPTIEKIRYYLISQEGLSITLDFFQQSLSGLFLLEIELPFDSSIVECDPLDYLPKDFQGSLNVTLDNYFKNQNLARLNKLDLTPYEV
jgi:CYTH domain-containing protein